MNLMSLLQQIPEWIRELWPYLTALTHFVMAPLATAHAVLLKRETNSVIGWVGVIWLVPIAGPALYAVFGVNRIARVGVQLEIDDDWCPTGAAQLTYADQHLLQKITREHPNMVALSKLGHAVTGMEITPGNGVNILQDGDEAFPSMIAAIDSAERSVGLLSYIFDSDRAGDAFLEALVRAQDRGVEVRVLIDHVGARYSKPNMIGRLRKAGITVGDFLPTGAVLLRYLNLRNHRKILVVDGKIGFTGGTNIREDHWLRLPPAYPVQCLHFRLTGPAVRQLSEAFAVDWLFTTKEELGGHAWFPATIDRTGDVAVRGVADGPDEDIDKISDVLIGGLAAATRRVSIVTPYFLPDPAVQRSLAVAAMSGVQVDIIIPGRNNIRIMDWAPVPLFQPLLEKGCRIYRTPEPFDHTKLFVIDGVWSLIGSTNWDPRSLRLNFEYNLECYSEKFASDLETIVDEKIRTAVPVTLEGIRARPPLAKLRDGLARLFSPYL